MLQLILKVSDFVEDHVSTCFFVLVHIKSDDDCWSLENNKTIEKNYALLVNFAPKIAYGKGSCSVHIENPWLPNMQNGFGLFLSPQQMDCSSILTINCLPDGVLHNQVNLFLEFSACLRDWNLDNSLVCGIHMSYEHKQGSNALQYT